ncbi:galanin receptor type 1 isoform X2 [Mustela erminea]|uniref:galanin receptor type 1 isoform X2 n=1 Tax=Mustela erminea TaxID=36723 RepID=UPI0013869ED5|nr:galanin receptor type 1 isoform X2 [Mustela erminea]
MRRLRAPLPPRPARARARSAPLGTPGCAAPGSRRLRRTHAGPHPAEASARLIPARRWAATQPFRTPAASARAGTSGGTGEAPRGSDFSRLFSTPQLRLRGSGATPRSALRKAPGERSLGIPAKTARGEQAPPACSGGQPSPRAVRSAASRGLCPGSAAGRERSQQQVQAKATPGPGEAAGRDQGAVRRRGVPPPLQLPWRVSLPRLGGHAEGSGARAEGTPRSRDCHPLPGRYGSGLLAGGPAQRRWQEVQPQGACPSRSLRIGNSPSACWDRDPRRPPESSLAGTVAGAPGRPRTMELAAGNLSEGNASGPEPPAAEPRPLFGVGVENFVTLVLFGLIFAFGVLGNSLVITVLARSKPGKPRSTTNLFILNLSIADLAYLLFCIPFQATVYALPTWVLGAFICRFIHYFFTVSMLVSIFTLAAMSVDRYVAIVHSRRSSSLRVSRNALLGLGFIWALSIAMALPVAYHHRLFHWEVSNQTFCWEQWPNQGHKKAYVVCTFVFGYLLPLLLICFCYAKVLNHLHKKLKNMSKKSEASKKKLLSIVFENGTRLQPEIVKKKEPPSTSSGHPLGEQTP